MLPSEQGARMEESAEAKVGSAMRQLLDVNRNTLYDAIARHYDEIIEARSRGYSLQAIATVLTDAGVPISRNVLHNYLTRIAATGRKAKPGVVREGHRKPPVENCPAEPVGTSENKERIVTAASGSTTAETPAASPQRASVPPSAATAPSGAGAPSTKPSIGKQEEKMPPVPSDWPKVAKRVNGTDVEFWKNPKWNTLYSVLPGIDPESPYGRNEEGVTYNKYGALTRQIIGKGFIGVDL